MITKESPKNPALTDLLDNPYDDKEEIIQPGKGNFPPNNQQARAINMPVDSHIRLLAGPGTGKTFTIARRVEYLVRSGINPVGIAVMTFSKNMSEDMAERILALCPEAIKHQISTIHAFCYRELCRNNPELQYYGWKVAGVSGSRVKGWQIKEEIDELVIKFWPKYLEEKPGYNEVLDWVATSKHYGIDSRESQRWFIQTLGTSVGLAIHNIRKEFDRWLAQNNHLTFADMLYLMEQELINDLAFKAKMQTKYTHIIIDEAQDTNYQAFRILYYLLEWEAKLFLVGDVNQMIYRFQGAKPELITSEIEAVLPNIQTVKLEINHRSQDEIISNFQELISNEYSDKGGPYSQDLFQDISGIKGAGGSLSFEMSETVFDESAWVAKEITAICQNGYKPGDIFVGARTRAQLGYLEGELFKAGVKFINLAGSSFWESKKIKDIVAYLRLAIDTTNGEAFEQVRNIPSNNNCWTKDDKAGKYKAGDYLHTRFLGPEFLNGTRRNFNNIDNFLIHAQDSWRYVTPTYLYDTYGPTKAQDYQAFVWDLQQAISDCDNVGQVVTVILDDCYTKYVKVTEGTEGDQDNTFLDNMATVVEIASQYTEVEDFLNSVDEMIKAARDSKEKNWDDYVVISTYHRLKGLERKIVFGMGWCEGEETGLLPHTFSLVEPPQFGVLPAGGKSPVGDERRIAFVAISRAMEKVFLSGCEEYRGNRMVQSRFIDELRL